MNVEAAWTPEGKIRKVKGLKNIFRTWNELVRKLSEI